MKEITEQEYKALKREVEDAKAEAQRAKGALDQLMAQLEKDFECHSLKEAKALLEELEAKRTKLHRKYQDAVEDYEKKWKREE